MNPTDSNASVAAHAGRKSPALRLIQGLVVGAIVWFATAVILGRIIAAVADVDPKSPPIRLGGLSLGFGLTFPSPRGNLPVGITLHWWNLPGTIVGAALAIWVLLYTFRAKAKSA